MSQKVDRNVAASVVQENFGLSADDLGIHASDDAFDNASDTDLADDNDDNIGGTQDLRNDASDLDDNLADPVSVVSRQKEEPQDDLISQPQQKPGLHHKAEVKTDARGNIINKQTGQIVAKAGKEARMYQQLHRSNTEIETLRAQNTDVESRLNRAVELGTGLFNELKQMRENASEVAPQRYGLSNPEAIEAMNFAKEAKSDPVGVIKKLLTKAASSGIDLSSIGLSGGNFDPKSLMDLVRQEISQQMNPLRERSQRESAQEQQKREATERETAATNTLQNFLKDNPEARAYLPVFQKIYQQPHLQHMPLGEVWARMQLNLMKRQQQAGNQRPTNQRQTRRAIPNGRRMPPGPGNGKSEMAPVSTSYEDIVRGLIDT